MRQQEAHGQQAVEAVADNQLGTIAEGRKTGYPVFLRPRSLTARYPGPKDCGERARETDLRVIP